MKVLVVMPAYEEWENLSELAPTINEVMSQSSDSVRWVVVTEPRTDLEIAHLLAVHQCNLNALVVARRSGNETFADAIQVGINLIEEDDDLIVFLDADQSHDPKVVPRLIDILREQSEVDVAIASRYTRGGSTDNSPLLRLMSICLNIAYRVVLNIGASDLSTNFKCYRSTLLRGIQLHSTNFEVVEELLMHASSRRRAIGKKLVVRELPDRFYVRKHGKSKRRLGQFVGTYLVSLALTKKRVSKSYRQPTGR